MVFADRIDAGRKLAALLADLRDEDPLVLGLARGGVVVASELARALGAPLEVWMVRKLGAPHRPELGIGAIGEGDEVYLDPELVRLTGTTKEDLTRTAMRESAELERRIRAFRRDRPPPAVAGRTVIAVDDGAATGCTARVALRALRKLGPRRLLLAVPVAATDTLEALRDEADEIVCVEPVAGLSAIGAHYADFTPISDEEVTALLDEAVAATRHDPRTGAPVEREVKVQAGKLELPGDRVVPDRARGLVIFAHGSGSSRRSPRNRQVAAALHQQGLGTLLFDLLTPEEEEEDEITAELRFDIGLLATRLAGATDWALAEEATRGLPIGYFGASTGAAAALAAAAEMPDAVHAIVSRGGRPDLAGPWLGRVDAPTLLLVGSADSQVLALNRAAVHRLRAPSKLAVVPGATHLFPEPGALEMVSRLAGEWFVEHLGRPALRRAG